MDGTFLITFIFTVSYCFRNMHIVNGQNTFSACSYGNIYDTNLYKLSLETCKKECGVRPSCQAVAYFRREQKCSLLPTSDGHDFLGGDRNCVHVAKQDIKQFNVCNCSEHDVCDPYSGNCHIKGNALKGSDECPRFAEIEKAVVFGNMERVGARLKIECAPEYREAEQQDTVTCLGEGSWSYQPKCIKITIGQACTNDSDCNENSSICIEGRCFCGPLYRYNTTSMDCVKVCSRMTDEFTKYPDIITWYLNLQFVYSYQCPAFCIDNPACQSYEFEANVDEVCITNLVSYEMAIDATPDLIYNMPGAVLMSRNCE